MERSPGRRAAEPSLELESIFINSAATRKGKGRAVLRSSLTLFNTPANQGNERQRNVFISFQFPWSWSAKDSGAGQHAEQCLYFFFRLARVGEGLRDFFPQQFTVALTHSVD